MANHSGDAPPPAQVPPESVCGRQVVPGGGAVLANKIEALKVLTFALLREVAALSSDPADDPHMSLQEETRHFEIELIRCALIRTGGRQRRAAKLLGISAATLNHKIKRYGILSDVVVRSLGTLPLDVDRRP